MGHIFLAISITFLISHFTFDNDGMKSSKRQGTFISLIFLLKSFLISPQYHSVKRVVQEAGQPKYSKFQYQTKLCKQLEILGSGNNNISQTQSESSMLNRNAFYCSGT